MLSPFLLPFPLQLFCIFSFLCFSLASSFSSFLSPSSFLVSPSIHRSASMACPTTLPAAACLLQPTSSPQLPGCPSHLARIHGSRGGVPLLFKKITQLHSNSPKTLLNILQQVSPPHCISNPLPDSLTTQPGSSIWLFKSPPLGKKCDLQQMKKNKPHMGVYNMTLLLFLLLFFRIFFNICRRFYYFHPIDIFY